MQVAVLIATNEIVILTGKNKIIADVVRYQVRRQHKNAFYAPSTYYMSWFAASHFSLLEDKWQ